MDCSTFRSWIYHFQAEEIPAAERVAFEAHLDACESCAQLLGVEEELLRGVRARMPREVAPPGLETRIRAALLDAAPEPRRVAWYRASWVAAAAAAVLLVVLLIPGLGTPLDTGVNAPGSVVQVIDREFTVVDLDCDQAGMPLDRQRHCTHPHHLNALKTADGRYWFISPDQDAYGELVNDRELRGRQLRIDGAYYPAINTLHIDDSRPAARDIL
jgi:hypothetical protein